MTLPKESITQSLAQLCVLLPFELIVFCSLHHSEFVRYFRPRDALVVREICTNKKDSIMFVIS
jgi:hypothetical protein